MAYRGLELSSGPLPDVIFECPTDELQLERRGGLHHISSHCLPQSGQGAHYAPSLSGINTARTGSVDELQMDPQDSEHGLWDVRSGQPKGDAPRQRRAKASLRRLSFSDREEFISAQLSAMSAPRRPASDSGGDGEDEEDEEAEAEAEEEVETDVDADEEEDADQMVESANIADEDDVLSSDGERGENASVQACKMAPGNAVTSAQARNYLRPEDIEDESSDDGVTLDFRTPGKPPGRSPRKRSLLEVNEAIVDVPANPTVLVPRNNSQTLAADPYSHLVDITPRLSGHDHHRLCCRPILKPSSTPLMPESTYRPGDLDGNTRRNSRKVVTEIVEDSRYFSQAESILHTSDPAKHMVMPRRSSSRYFADVPHVEVEDSEQVIAETSPEPPDFTNMGQLQILRRSSELGDMSRTPSKPPQDLRSLTRSVSRENGTLSQSKKRRASLPFHSPAKMR